MTDEHALAAFDVSLAYDGANVVSDLTLEVPDHQLTVIVGANASGKSTLLRGLARQLRPTAGMVKLDGRSIRARSMKEVARTLTLLPQAPVAPEGISVVDLVGRGRYPHQGWFRQWSDDDETAVAAALRATDTLNLAHRAVDELSGGQRQRVWIAMALAQQTDILLLDEPTAFLDVTHQVDVLDVIVDLQREHGTTVVIVLHDLNFAARYADYLVALKGGEVAASGAPAEVVTEDTVWTVFGLECCVAQDPVSHTPIVLPIGRHHLGSRRKLAGDHSLVARGPQA